GAGAAPDGGVHGPVEPLGGRGVCRRGGALPLRAGARADGAAGDVDVRGRHHRGRAPRHHGAGAGAGRGRGVDGGHRVGAPDGRAGRCAGDGGRGCDQPADLVPARPAAGGARRAAGGVALPAGGGGAGGVRGRGPGGDAGGGGVGRLARGGVGAVRRERGRRGRGGGGGAGAGRGGGTVAPGKALLPPVNEACRSGFPAAILAARREESRLESRSYLAITRRGAALRPRRARTKGGLLSFRGGANNAASPPGRARSVGCRPRRGTSAGRWPPSTAGSIGRAPKRSPRSAKAATRRRSAFITASCSSC